MSVFTQFFIRLQHFIIYTTLHQIKTFGLFFVNRRSGVKIVEDGHRSQYSVLFQPRLILLDILRHELIYSCFLSTTVTQTTTLVRLGIKIVTLNQSDNLLMDWYLDRRSRLIPRLLVEIQGTSGDLVVSPSIFLTPSIPKR